MKCFCVRYQLASGEVRLTLPFEDCALAQRHCRWLRRRPHVARAEVICIQAQPQPLRDA